MSELRSSSLDRSGTSASTLTSAPSNVGFVTGRLERLLDVEPVVGDVGDELRVRLAWLKPP